MTALLGILVLSCCASASFAAASTSTSPAPKAPPPSRKKVDQKELDDWFNSDDSPQPPKVDCQNLSNTKLAWTDPGDHRGMAGIEEWAGFKVQKCATKPTAYTNNPSLLSSYYSTKLSDGQVPPNYDPALTEKQSVDSGGDSIVGNIVSGKTLELNSSGVLSLKSGSTAQWSTPAGSASGTYTLKFDANTYNAGNLCVFDKNGATPWCMLPRIAVSTSGSSTTGQAVNLSATQQSQLAGGKMKNNSDNNSRFVMIDDSGAFCMYRGNPGAPSGSPIVCK